MKILLASSEVHPYSKTGGLADMVGALAKALARDGHQVGLVTPLYAGIAERFPGGLQTVHNGFLETYFDGGAISIVLLVLFLIIGFLRTVRRTLQNTLFGRFTLVLFIVALIYNYSETSFFRFEPLWFTLLMTTIDYDKLLTRREIVARASYARCETVHSGSY